ncbi:MAG: T9SS type A sorting domain-containing protein [Dysgonamonadaceae bacterium]|jgi:hypothetical protein|nr:T9SS type A sorting domain-containing protein [Dysgonamonadaceae bacterium]
MKKIDLRKALLAVFICGSAMFASANEVYVSATGNDSNDGASSATPYATLGKALTSVDENGTIHVSGLIYTCNDPLNPVGDGDLGTGLQISKNVTIEGDAVTSGFVGFDEVVTWQAGRMFRITAGTLTLKTLTLTNGYGFNKAGAVHVNGGALVAENVIFENNHAVDGESQPAGGAIQVDKTTGISFKSCLFKSNVALKGGAFYIQDTQNASVELRFEACSFIGNRSNQGGASCSGLFFRLAAENPTVNIINCTFSGNVNGGNGGTVYIYGVPTSATFNIINTTMVDNIGTSGGGSGAGIKQEEVTNRPTLRILNSIIEGNAVNSGTTAEDLVYGYEPFSSQLQVSNSFIGNVWVAAGTIPEESYTGNTYWNYMSRTFNRFELQSGVDVLDANLNVYKLSEGSNAVAYGNATFLQNIGINTDALGGIRTFANGKCSAGAIEYGASSSITPVDLQDAVSIEQQEGRLTVKTTESSSINLTLYAVSGQSVAQQSARGTALSAPVGQLKGLYIARVSLNGKVYTQKVRIK